MKNVENVFEVVKKCNKNQRKYCKIVKKIGKFFENITKMIKITLKIGKDSGRKGNKAVDYL